MIEMLTASGCWTAYRSVSLSRDVLFSWDAGVSVAYKRLCSVAASFPACAQPVWSLAYLLVYITTSYL
jgi:hypothetical protein